MCDLTDEINRLLTLINALSSNMNSVSPYARFAARSASSVSFPANVATPVVLNVVEATAASGSSYTSLNPSTGVVTLQPGVYRTRVTFGPMSPTTYWKSLFVKALLYKTSGSPSTVISTAYSTPYSLIWTGNAGWGAVTLVEKLPVLEGDFDNVGVVSTYSIQLNPNVDNGAVLGNLQNTNDANTNLCTAEFWKVG